MLARPSACSGTLAGGVLGAEIDQHQMIVRAARDDIEPILHQRRRQRAGIGDDLPRIGLELGLQCFLERHGLGRDDVHQRAALQAGEHGRVDLLGHLLVIGEDHAAARTAQRFVRGRRRDVGMRHWRGMNAAGDEAGDVGHVDHEIGADFVGDLAEPLPVPDARIGGAAREDQLGLVLARLGGDLVHIEQMIFAAHAVAHDLEPFAGHVDRRAVREVAARIEVEAHEGIARLQQREEHGLVHLRCRSSAAHWRSRRRTAAWRARWRASRRCPQIGSRHSSACRGNPPRICWS